MSKPFLQVLQTLTQQMLCQQICLLALPLLLAFELVLVVLTGKSEGCVSSFYPHTHLTLMPL